MVKLSPRLLILAGVGAVPLCFITYLLLGLFTASRLLNSGSTIPTYIGFYLWYPGLTGKVSNLRCMTNGHHLDGYAYYCRFKVKPADIKRFVEGRKLKSGMPSFPNECHSVDFPPSSIEPYPMWWKPGELEVEGGAQCYSQSSVRLVYSPKSQIAYMSEAD